MWLAWLAAFDSLRINCEWSNGRHGTFTGLQQCRASGQVPNPAHSTKSLVTAHKYLRSYCMQAVVAGVRDCLSEGDVCDFAYEQGVDGPR